MQKHSQNLRQNQKRGGGLDAYKKIEWWNVEITKRFLARKGRYHDLWTLQQSKQTTAA